MLQIAKYARIIVFWEMDKVGIPTPFSDKVGGGKMQTSSPPVITPNRSQSNPDDMITLPRPIQSVGMDLHDVSGTSTGQTLPRERRAPPGTHFCPTIWWVYPYSATIFILHPLLSTLSSTFVRNIKQQLQGSCARVRRIQNARRRNHLRMVRGGAQTHTRSAAAAARILRPGPQDPNARRRNHLRMVRGGAQTHTRSAAVTDV